MNFNQKINLNEQAQYQLRNPNNKCRLTSLWNEKLKEKTKKNFRGKQIQTYLSFCR